MAHSHAIGNVRDMGLREAITIREQTQASGELCDSCNMRNRYQGGELAQVAASYFKHKLIAAAS